MPIFQRNESEMDFLDVIRDTFSYCKSEELAYIITRTKGERHFIAKIGFYIEKILEANLYTQIEETFFDNKEIGLTILDREKEPPDDLLCALEANLHYTFDLGMNFNPKICDEHIKTLNRLNDFGYTKTKKILLVLFTHYGDEVPSEFAYDQKHNLRFNESGSYGMSELAQSWIENYFENKILRQKRYLLGSIEIGSWKKISLVLFYGILEFL